jgi:HEAT repeat protein
MPVARRFGRVTGDSKVADELLFQLLARPLGSASKIVISTMAVLKGPDAKAALKQCIRASNSKVRRQSIPVLAPLCNEDDVPFALSLSLEQSLDLRLRGVDLLKAIGSDAATSRLILLLSKGPALAAYACDALVTIGQGAVPALHKRVMQPVVDRSFVYAAFALAQISRQSGANVLPPELLEPLAKRLRAPEALTRVLAAVPLADLVYRAAPGDGVQLPDAELVEALLLVVSPQQFVPNIDMVRSPAEQRLLRHTGRVITMDDTLSWRDWWKIRKDSFLGVRSNVVVDAKNAGSAVITLRQPGQVVRLLGEDVAYLKPQPNMKDVLLSSEQILSLVQSLEQDGYGSASLMPIESALPRVRTLEVRVAGGRSSVAVTERQNIAFDSMVASVEACLQGELWQLFRVAADEPDRAAFWRSEQKWRAAHPGVAERGRRLLDRVVRGWSTWGVELQTRAIGFFAGNPERNDIIGEPQGRAIVAVLNEHLQMSSEDLQLLELAASAPGDTIWRDCIEIAVSKEGGGRKAVAQVFKVLGPDAVLSAMKDVRPVVRRAAVDEVIAVRDPRAAPILISLLSDLDISVQKAAVFACGHLKVAQSSSALVKMIAAPETDPGLRRDCLRAIGKVGSAVAFSVLQQSMASPSKADKEAAMRGLGELRDPRAAHLLAEFVVVGYGKEIGNTARFHLQRQGAMVAVPALERQIRLVQDARIRADLVLLLGLYQDPKNVPDLLDLLRQPEHGPQAAIAIEGSTGVDLANVPDRISAAESWWRQNKQIAQSQWLLDALRRDGVATNLTLENFAGDNGKSAIAELARLMVEAPQPRLWVLSSAVMRTVAKQDYGIVTAQTPPDVRKGMADRYLLLVDLDEGMGR